MENSTEDCLEPMIAEFPQGPFTKEELQSGWITIYVLITFYLFYSLAIVCDDYFVPSVEVMAKILKIPSEIAGCTILGISNSSPELFTNIIATFIAQGDLGISSIVGASVFNLFAVAACIGIISKKVGAKIEWWPLTRDSLVYVISISALAIMLRDNHVHWYDGVILLCLYGGYILIIIFNRRFRRLSKVLIHHCNFMKTSTELYKINNCLPTSASSSSSSVLQDILDAEDSEPIPDQFDDQTMPLFVLPRGEAWYVWLQFIVGWPIRLVYKITIPDCKISKLQKFYPLTLTMCIAWNTILCYLLGWMVTVIGWALGIPDTVMGLTLFAVGTSVPQAVSSIIVARRGMGTMAMNNAIGSNIFNVLVCLGLPWLIQTIILANDASTNERYVVVNSQSMGYTSLILIACTIALFLIIASNGFVVDKRVGVAALISYFVIITLAALFELNVFVQINPPMCST